MADKLLDHEKDDADYIDNGMLAPLKAYCPTCKEYGPFGQVPVEMVAEGALIGVCVDETRVQEQKDADAWLKWFFGK